MKISLQSKIKYSIGYCDNPVNVHHDTYKVAVNMLLLSGVSLTVSLFALLTENVNLMSYFISGIIAVLYLLIWKAILFPTGK